VFHTILRINSDYFLKQHQPIDICNGEVLCFLCGAERSVGESLIFYDNSNSENYILSYWYHGDIEREYILLNKIRHGNSD
jgi:hypothetical protein